MNDDESARKSERAGRDPFWRSIIAPPARWRVRVWTRSGEGVEAAGIEPASRNISTRASTCVVGLFPLLACPPPADRVRGK
jgi:hypothetical protein